MNVNVLFVASSAMPPTNLQSALSGLLIPANHVGAVALVSLPAIAVPSAIKLKITLKR